MNRNNLELETIDPALIVPLHEPRNQQLLEELVASMTDEGWQGRPILVIQRGDSFYAWTGSHRIAAAIEAKLDGIPCYVVDEKKLPEEINAQWGHVHDYDRFNALVHTKDETAIHLMWLEERS